MSGAGKFRDFKGGFNYMLVPTSSGYDHRITHVIYQQDICIHNKPKAKHEISLNAKAVKLGHTVGRCPLQGGRRDTLRPSPCLHDWGVPTHHGHVAPSRGMHSAPQVGPEPLWCVSSTPSQRGRAGKLTPGPHRLPVTTLLMSRNLPTTVPRVLGGPPAWPRPGAPSPAIRLRGEG